MNSNPTGFIEFDRTEPGHRAVAERLGDYREMDIPLDAEEINRQAQRCMDCGVPFCHGYGCPLNNRIPDFNDLVAKGRWEEACAILHETNNFPEFTGRLCPAPCEAACTLNLEEEPTLIRHIECQIAEKGWEEGWIVPQPSPILTGKRVAIVGSGPAGLAAAQQLARMGHYVTVYEKDEEIGGLLRFGIPDFKLQKEFIERRLDQMRVEGVTFETSVTVGEDISANYLTRRYDAVLLANGAGVPRDLVAKGRGLEGVEFALDFLIQQQRINSGKPVDKPHLNARDKVVVVIGGGDTGSDCIGTARRQGAKNIIQLEILPKPPETRDEQVDPWPTYPKLLKTSTSHEEGCERRWCVLTKKIIGRGVNVTGLQGVEVKWDVDKNGKMTMSEVPGSEFTIDCDMVILAMGFVHVAQQGIVNDLGLELDGRGNIKVDGTHHTSREGVFAAGDCDRGASLIVHAIKEGRDAADEINAYLKSKD